MPNPHGTPIWYELVTADPDAAKPFYDAVIGWTIAPRPPGEMDYRMIATPDGGNVGGVAGIGPGTPEMASKPGWRFYVGVDDVDAAAAAIRDAGGTVAIPPFDLPDVGRMALVADPQGVAFFVMRGFVAQDSAAFERTGMGKCNWNELVTSDQAAANDFYARVFGWRYPDRMPMGDMGDYVFIEVAGTQIGATMTAPADGPPPAWRFYFRVPDIDAAVATVRERGGTVLTGPHTVPGGDRIIVALDPEGLTFGAVGPGEGGDR